MLKVKALLQRGEDRAKVSQTSAVVFDSRGPFATERGDTWDRNSQREQEHRWEDEKGRKGVSQTSLVCEGRDRDKRQAFHSSLANTDKKTPTRAQVTFGTLSVALRDFLSRPLGQEDNGDPWDAWAPFLSWLSAHHPDRFQGVCEAENALHELERQGIRDGSDYEKACQELALRFEAARRLRFKACVRVWLQ
jgi:hypothetical protein